MKGTSKMRKSDDSELCPGIDDDMIMEYLISILKQGQLLQSEKRAIVRLLQAYMTLRRNLCTGSTMKQRGKLRNCDVMTTAAALRKGWERRCEYGTPCCPFEYAMEEFK